MALDVCNWEPAASPARRISKGMMLTWEAERLRATGPPVTRQPAVRCATTVRIDRAPRQVPCAGMQAVMLCASLTSRLQLTRAVVAELVSTACRPWSAARAGAETGRHSTRSAGRNSTTKPVATCAPLAAALRLRRLLSHVAEFACVECGRRLRAGVRIATEAGIVVEKPHLARVADADGLALRDDLATFATRPACAARHAGAHGPIAIAHFWFPRSSKRHLRDAAQLFGVMLKWAKNLVQQFEGSPAGPRSTRLPRNSTLLHRSTASIWWKYEACLQCRNDGMLNSYVENEFAGSNQTLCPSAHNKTAMSACTFPHDSQSSGPTGVGSSHSALGDHLVVDSGSVCWPHLPAAWRRANRFRAGAATSRLRQVTHKRQ